MHKFVTKISLKGASVPPSDKRSCMSLMSVLVSILTLWIHFVKYHGIISSPNENAASMTVFISIYFHRLLNSAKI